MEQAEQGYPASHKRRNRMCAFFGSSCTSCGCGVGGLALRIALLRAHHRIISCKCSAACEPVSCEPHLPPPEEKFMFFTVGTPSAPAEGWTSTRHSTYV
eukprot:scaffold10451_cov121-Isochrysis_galbana.AAC.9